MSSMLLSLALPSFFTAVACAQQAPIAAPAPAPTVAINGALTEGSTISITPSVSGVVYVYSKPKVNGDKCGTASIPINTTVPSATAASQDVTLKTAIKVDDEVCVALLDTKTTLVSYASAAPAIVQAVPALPPHPDPAFVGSAIAGNAITVTAEQGATLIVVIQPSAYAAKATDCKTSAGLPNAVTETFAITSADAQELTLKNSLQAGDIVCLASSVPAAPAALYSAKMVKVVAPPSSPVNPAFAGPLVGGSKTVLITGQLPVSPAKTPTIAIYQFPESYVPRTPSDGPLKTGTGLPCGEQDIASLQGTPLSVTTSGSSSTQTSVTLNSENPPPYNTTLATQLVAGSKLCLVQTDTSKTPATIAYSTFGEVSDPGDSGRARFDFTAGSVISNQQSSAKSSTASTYLDFGYYFTLMRAGGSTITPVKGSPKKNYTAWKPGIEDFIDLRMTSVPVATSTNTTTVTAPSGSNNATATSSTSPNVLTSQQAATIYGGFDFPLRITRWDSNSNAFYLAPVVRSGFATLLNPSVDSSATSTNTGTNTISSSTTAQFNSVYWHEAQGLRIGWAKYPPNTDKAPVPIAQFDMMEGKYSNLPSIICDPAKAVTVSTQPSNTSCYKTTTTGGTTAYSLYTSRTLIPRLQLAGFIKFPNIPFLMGVDANLAQYAFGPHKNAVDTVNKAGDDVRIYFGVNLDPVSAIKKLGVVLP
jgi:hypothetical protein